MENLTFTREQAELLVTKNFPSETPTYATPVRAYDGDLDPAWVVLTSSDHVFLVDRVAVVKYEKSREVRLPCEHDYSYATCPAGKCKKCGAHG